MGGAGSRGRHDTPGAIQPDRRQRQQGFGHVVQLGAVIVTPDNVSMLMSSVTFSWDGVPRIF